MKITAEGRWEEGCLRAMQTPDDVRVSSPKQNILFWERQALGLVFVVLLENHI